MAAIECGKRGRKTLLLERSSKPAEKIRISGGGRCNFTNLHTSPSDFLSDNPRFCISALKRYPQNQFIDLVNSHNISFHEKKLGQLFCDGSSQQIIEMLLAECEAAGVEIRLDVDISSIKKPLDFEITTNIGKWESASIIIATGGKSIPKMGATSFGYDVAQQFGLSIVTPEPALVPLTFDGDRFEGMKKLAGISLDSIIRYQKNQFSEALLFTHRGLSGPAVLQISSYWHSGQAISINLAPNIDAYKYVHETKLREPKTNLTPLLNELLPNRLTASIADELNLSGQLANIPDRSLKALAQRLNNWQIVPSGSEGYRTAEVTRGGVCTNELSSKTMEAKKVPGLFFIGEVVDVTGHLGGFNFQWAWSSGFAAGQYA